MTPASWLPVNPRPGTNLKGDAAGAAWTYLLDRMEVARALVVGDPGEASMRTIRRVARDVTTVSKVGLLDRGGASPAGPFDLVALADPVRAGEADRALVDGAVRLLAQGGRIWLETRDPDAAQLAVADAGAEPGPMLSLAPQRGEPRSLVPADDEPIRRFFADERIVVDSLPRPLRPIERRWPSLVQRRVGILAGGSATTAGAVPAYIVDLAAAEGADLSRHRFSVSARGRYSSRKVIGYCFPPAADRPDVIVKLTRDAAFNDRLENEEAVLRLVHDDRVVDPLSAPRVIFAGLHAGLRVLGQEAIEGVPLTRLAGDPGTMERAYRWVTDLADSSARRGPEASRELRRAIESVADGIRRIYRPDAEATDRLAAAVERVVTVVDRVPSVLLHGDCATWNGWVRDDGRIAFLDWEAAGAGAPPLWDLISLARSDVGLRTGFLRRSRRGPDAILAAMARDPLFQAAIEEYRTRLRLPSDVVAPLFALCWAFRALREVPRLGPARLQTGIHYRLLLASLEPASMRLWDGGASAERVAAV